tara:strand:+ start:1242 stop:1451 length:210 start_codon:yes stop_codon:yes gene_type:complete
MANITGAVMGVLGGVLGGGIVGWLAGWTTSTAGRAIDNTSMASVDVAQTTANTAVIAGASLGLIGWFSN